MNLSPYTVGCVYLAQNTVNGHCYIGKTINGLHVRKQDHEGVARRDKANTYFYNALKKYGQQCFSWSELYLSDCDQALKQAEIEIIKTCKTHGVVLYNRTAGGDGISGMIHTPEQIEARKLKNQLLERRGSRGGGTGRRKRPLGIGKGVPRSEEVRKKIGDSQRGKPKPPRKKPKTANPKGLALSNELNV